jgi:hypothetical protein
MCCICAKQTQNGNRHINVFAGAIIRIQLIFSGDQTCGAFSSRRTKLLYAPVSLGKGGCRQEDE